LFVLPIKHRILFNEEEKLKQSVFSFINNFAKSTEHEKEKNQ
jgi:hypothetical protein